MDRMEIIPDCRLHREREGRESRGKHLIPERDQPSMAWIPRKWSIDDDALLLMIRRYTPAKRVCVISRA